MANRTLTDTPGAVHCPAEPPAAASPPDATVIPEPKGSKRHAALRWVGVGLVAAVLVGGLAYAETGWLAARIPHDKPTRVALVAFPSAGELSGGQPALATDWPGRLVSEADKSDIQENVASRLPSLKDASGQPLGPAQLASRMSLGSSCIQIQPLMPGAKAVRGVLLYNVVRGGDEQETSEIARAWSAAVVADAAGQFPGLTVEPVESLGAPYEMCN